METIRKYLYRFGYKTQLMAGLAVMIFSNAVVFFTAYAQTPAAQGIAVTNTQGLKDNVLCPIFNAMFFIIIIFSTIMILWAAFTYMRAQDDAEKVTMATKTITYAAIGIVVALIAKVAPNVIGSIFSGVNITGC